MRYSREIKTEVMHWWVFLLAGLLFIITGIAALRYPIGRYISLSLLFGTLMVLQGIKYAAFAAANRKRALAWGWTFAFGFLNILLGIILFSYPGMTIAVLPFIVGAWLLLNGISFIVYTADLKRLFCRGRGWLLAGGILTIVLSVPVFMYPVSRTVTFMISAATAFVVSGISSLVLAFRFRQAHEKLFRGEKKYKIRDV